MKDLSAPPETSDSPRRRTMGRGDPVGAEDWKANPSVWRRIRRGVVFLFAAAAGVALLVGIVLLATRENEDSGTEAPVEEGYSGPSHLTVVAVRTRTAPFAAIVASMGSRRPFVIAVPSRLVMTLPGHGSGTLGDATSSPTLLVASLSNVLGTWIEHHDVMEEEDLASLIDAYGGVSVDLDEPMTFRGREIGPGTVELDGEDALTYLATAGKFERDGRWLEVLTELFREKLPTGAFGEVDDRVAVAEALAAAEGASVVELPNIPSGGGLARVDDPAVADLLASEAGIRLGRIEPVVVLNGTGRPGIGEDVAALLVPGGFRIVASGNAATFAEDVTTIQADSKADRATARRAARLLGVGAVTLGGVPTALADVTIVVGKDFLRE